MTNSKKKRLENAESKLSLKKSLLMLTFGLHGPYNIDYGGKSIYFLTRESLEEFLKKNDLYVETEIVMAEFEEHDDTSWLLDMDELRERVKKFPDRFIIIE